jgi:hypothetical protein
VENIYTSSKHLLQVQKIKYKFMTIPLIVVLGSLITSRFINMDYLKFVSLFGLILYIIIMLYFKIDRLFTPDRKESILSPISGKILSFDKHSRLVIIKKTFRQNVEIRNPSEDEQIEPIFNKKVNLFIKKSILKGELIGVFIGSGLCELKIPLNYILKVQIGEIVTSGDIIFTKDVINKEENV